MNIQRGEFGYLAARKKRAWLGVLAMVVLGVSIFVLGLLLNKMSNRNIFTVIAVLFVLPGARFLVGAIITFPYKSVEKERYEKVRGELPENTLLMTDMVITSSEKIMHLDFVVVGNGQVIALMGQGKQELGYVRKYLTTGVKNWGTGYHVRVFDKEKAFLAELAKMEVKEVDREEEEKVISFLRALIV